MRIAFMGTPDFSVPALAALIQAGHEVLCVYSQPPRPANRGQKERPTPVHAFAAEKGIDVRYPVNFKDPADVAVFQALELDVAVVAAYGLILPQSILDAPKLGCLNIHASLLPRWRGAAPIQRAIQAGDTETGICIMQMEAGLDTGPVLMRGTLPITETTTGQSLHDDLSELGGRLIVMALESLGSGGLPSEPQPEAGVTYAKKLTKEESRLDWSLPADVLARTIRAFHPWPGTWFEHGKAKGKEERIKVLGADIETASGEPGAVLDDGGLIACGEGSLRLTRLQRAGKSAADADAFFRGYDIKKGETLGA